MIYKLASRDNTYSERFEAWPAVLNNLFTKFNNTIEEHTFCSEDDVLNWLESKSRTKSNNRYTNSQEFKNGDPNKLYSVYCCEHQNPNHGPELRDTFLYNLKYKKPHETWMTFINEKGTRNKSSFKKINIRHNTKEEVEYSSDVREIGKVFFEGIYPIIVDENDKIETVYMKFVKSIHDLDSPENKKLEYSVVVMNKATRWIDLFLERLEHVEKILEFFARGGDTIVSLYDNESQNFQEHRALVQHIFKLMEDNKLNTPDDNEMQISVRNIVTDPLLCTDEIYQVRYQESLITWHRNYSYMIRKYNLVPSKQFSNMILNFNLSDFFKQIQTKENLLTLINNLEEIYGIHYLKTNPKNKLEIQLLKGPVLNPKFQRITKSFN
jgi:hypothetical protein